MANKKTAVMVLGLAMVAGGFFLLVRKKGIPLEAGWNEVKYTGKSQTAGVALASIADYLVLAYYFDAVGGYWMSVLDYTILEPGMELSIKVSQDCTWTF